jgi:D-alanyl-D-alanine carboxypeptidase
MVLYAAKLKESAKPVTTDLTPPKLTRKEKQAIKQQEADLKKQQEQVEAELAAKQLEIAAAEQALADKKAAQKEKRRLAREAKKAVIPESVSESIPMTEDTLIEEPVIAPKVVDETPVKKSRKRKQPPPTPAPSLDEQVDEAVEQVTQDQEPPAWFKKYVTGVKNEESHLRSPKKPKRQVAKEATQMANEQWGKGLVRDRVRNEVDQHMSRMYQMIFNRGL